MVAVQEGGDSGLTPAAVMSPGRERKHFHWGFQHVGQNRGTQSAPQSTGREPKDSRDRGADARTPAGRGQLSMTRQLIDETSLPILSSYLSKSQ